ncbi:MAG: right-handed parallel beta-helix repeat-containing protein [Caldilineaceae bacterium]
MFIQIQKPSLPQRERRWLWFLWVLIPLLLAGPLRSWAQVDEIPVEEVRTLYPSEWGVPHPAGLAYSLARDQLALVAKPISAQSTLTETKVVVITPYEDLISATTLPLRLDNAVNIAYDDSAAQLLLLNNTRAEMAQVAVGTDGNLDPANLTHTAITHLDLHAAAGMGVDATSRQLFILESATSAVISVDLDHALALLTTIDLAFLGAPLRGLAVHPVSHHLFLADPTQALLYEVTQAGQLVHTYDLASLALVDLQGLAFGPSADLTDDPTTMHLFLADSNLPDGETPQLFGRILEIALPAEPATEPQQIVAQVASIYDDSEETIATGATNLDSGDLELIRGENGDQIVGVRFETVNIPAGATVLHAYIKFTVDETSSEPTSLILRGEAADNAARFAEPNSDLSRRVLTTANVTWPDVPAWDLVAAQQQTPDLASVVQEIVDRAGWQRGNALAFIISGTGQRTAEAYDGDPVHAPRLLVEYLEALPTPTPTPTATVTPAPTLEPQALRFAVIGDYGNNSVNEARVATLVASWQPDFVITTGDNNYPNGADTTIDNAIGQYYSEFIGNYQGAYGPGSLTNRFWPSLGNHDWGSLTCSGVSCSGAYFDYFTLPNHERYYATDLGLVHLFALDSESEEPDSRGQDSIQADWLRRQLAQSNACYNLVYFHRPPYSSGKHGSNLIMQWPFADWGADVVMSGHDHLYERLQVNGLPYFVNGAGGAGLYTFDNVDSLPPEATSVVRYNEDYGAMLVTAAMTGITYQFYNAAGLLIDEYTESKACATNTATPTATPTATLLATSPPTTTPTLIATLPPTMTPTRVIHVPADALTIQAAIDQAADGDLILVSPGLYQENLRIAGKTISLASEFYTTNDSSLIDQTIIDGGGKTVITVGAAVGPETQIIGFTIQNGDDGISPAAKIAILHNHITGNRDGIDYEGGGGLCQENLFTQNGDDAIDLDGATEVTIEDNMIRDSGDDGIEIRLHPYQGPTLNIIIRRNLISGNEEDGIQLVGYNEPTDRFFLIEHNVIRDNFMAGIGLMDQQETLEDLRGASIPERIHLFNNTFIANDHGLTGGDNLVALHNIFVDSPNLALKNVDGASIAAYNLFWGNGADQQDSILDSVHTLWVDPRLDATAHLMTDSPAIDAGTALFTWNSEIVLDLQPSDYAGMAPDLGAYETQLGLDAEAGNPQANVDQLFLPVVMNQ